MKFFLDTEFTDNGKTIELISIGIVSERGQELYAVNSDAPLHLANDWVRKNVLPRLPKYGAPAWMTKSEIAGAIDKFVFLEQFHDHTTAVQFWGYYCAYDWVAFCQLWGRMLDIPKQFPRHCMDLKQLSVSVGSPKHPATPTDAHDALVDARWCRELYAFLTKGGSGEQGTTAQAR